MKESDYCVLTVEAMVNLHCKLLVIMIPTRPHNLLLGSLLLDHGLNPLDHTVRQHNLLPLIPLPNFPCPLVTELLKSSSLSLARPRQWLLARRPHPPYVLPGDGCPPLRPYA